MLSVDSDVELQTWQEYHDWIKGLDGKAAEPLGDGWAASSFLNRCASTISGRWLFDRATMTPEIDATMYVDVLEQLKATVKHYDQPFLNPSQIWRRLRLGRLRGGIGYQCSVDLTSDDESGEELFEVTVSNCPVESQLDRLWFDPATPIAVMSEACRQTDASKAFIRWLAGGQGNQMLSSQITGFSVTRDSSTAQIDPASDSGGSKQVSEYDRWLIQRLTSRQHAAGLILPQAHAYYDALDQHVMACLTGEQSAKDSLQAAAKDWERITEAEGRQAQIVAWRNVR